jgi:EF-hand domain pair
MENIKFLTIDTNNIDKAIEELIKQKNSKLKLLKDSKSKILNSQGRFWLKKTGKKHYIDFDDSMRAELRKYFLSMNPSGSKSIGVEELLEPLIALGLAENRSQVQSLFDIVDANKSGKIEFEEFLSILRHGEGDSPMVELFREMTRGKLVEDANVLPFNLVVSSYRRRMLMNAVISEDPDLKTKGEKIFKAYSKQLENKNTAKAKK